MLDIITHFSILIMSVVIHEVAHGYAADMLGDPTPRLQKRLSLNPLVHADIFGSFIVPVLTYFAGGGIFGWAKPVLINPYNFTRRRFDELMVALAGPLSNIVLALVFLTVGHFALVFNVASQALIEVCVLIASINLMLAFFNLIPIPPLDGSKILFLFLPEKFSYIRAYLELGGFIFIIVFVKTISPFISSITSYIVSALL